MADGVDHIDIYADVGEEFNQEAEYGGHDQIDLYDDVISPSANNGDAPEDRDYMDTLPPTVGDDVGKGAAPNVVYTYTGKRIALYIGNLTWWTTDEDLTEAVHSLGVNDILEIKFFENRANGQSKGFALVGVGSEASSKKLMDLLPKRELHGQNPVVTPCNKQFLSQFEMQSRKSAPPPAPHVNPAFFPPPTNSGMPTSDSRGPPPTDPYGRPPPYDRGDYGPPGREMDTARTPLSEAEFEEIMNRNRAISSSAISRAVSDASAGDYGSAIETLVTAISLIKQSKVSADDRCKVLISSLQDCLHGIESKSYGSGSRRRERSRERDHSRSREKSRRHKSRSRDRHDDYYRERSRERERHRDRDRDRDRERDREREYRHR
ncbi:cleavage and polyadenylation specificity factor subunit 6 isoform X5 [Trichechus manatus latirostris]|uniref:Cleavage and polyadenylation specificity factor subunit 6 n=2 Tax=Eutheria TaxID=9347 RepID=A0A2Y9G9A1_NEOSC|nr:cleavage and polyadenylation specificity factor subunit 6 isoform X6 [Neomonachus schauinslandi]XP_023596573.1 cleavage and polyadenylation specificity factor subunit 6 isoform X5 [Trichechus manatus latirostris]